MDHAPILEMRDVTKRYGAIEALSNVSLSVSRGEILGLCGENGAGKSTLMKCLSGSIGTREFDGEIRIDGRDAHFHSPFDAEAAGIEMIYQEISLNLDLSIAENIFLGRLPTKSFGRVDWARAFRDAEAALEQVGLDIDVRDIVRGLSTSKQQMIAIARSIIRDPAILVLDEPTSALTGAEADKLFELLDKIRDRGTACIYISHKMDEVFRLCDRITVLRDGRNVATYPVADTLPQTVISDMVGRQLDTLYAHATASVGDECLRLEKIDIRHPTKADRLLVSDVSLALRQGEILGLFGLVGAGRSELMNAVFDGSYRHMGRAAGKVTIGGAETTIRSPADAIAHGIAMLTEDRKTSGFVGTMSIARNITLAGLRKLANFGVLDRRAEIARASELSDQLAVKAPGVTAGVLSLSGGNQQKVVLAKWMFTQPKILILDEPTRGIDVGAKAEIYRLMSRWVGEGMAIILISSEMTELLAMSDRIVVLGGGGVSGEFSRGDVTQEELLECAAGERLEPGEGRSIH
ncbi:sugar ABC transporter ATP-binding protein [Oricola sp.]|uniref:sugar ABC transporter ATP-binding protein n=1 Tax=Oricola sp. TaxID=1979950 RepID=UPI003BAC2A0B